MKKVLLGTSAIALAGAFVSPANAAEWTVKIGGYMEQYVAYADTDADSVDGDFSGVDIKDDAEIYFHPSITLDNGVQFLMNVELEVDQTSGVDEPYLDISGSFGKIILGEDNLASYNLAYAAPHVSFLGINSGSDVKFYAADSNLTTFTHTFPQTATDPVGISYYTPRLAGFQIGASYARDANRSDDDEQIDTDASGELHDIWAVGANYVNSFGDFNIAASGGYSRGSRNGHDASGDGLYFVPESGGLTENNGSFDAVFGGFGGFIFDNDLVDNDVIHVNCEGEGAEGFVDVGNIDNKGQQDAALADLKSDGHIVLQEPDCFDTANSDPSAWAAGLNLGYGGFTIGGSYYEEHDDRTGDPKTWDVGVSYETGPWGFSFTYVNYEDELDLDVERYLLAISYGIAQGVTMNVLGSYSEAELETLDSADERISLKDKGYIVGTGVKVSF